MELAKILAKEVSLAIPIDGETLNVTYLPGAYTPEFEDAFLTMLEKNRAGNGLAKYLTDLVTAWDLTIEGAPVKLDEATLRKVPGQFLGKVADAIAEDINPKKAKSSNSKDGYLARAE